MSEAKGAGERDPANPIDLSDAPWPHFATDEIGAAEAVLRSGKVNYWTGGENDAFEKEFARYCGVPHGIALANGTLALELALRALDIGPGDDVIVTPRSYFASTSSVLLLGANPVFADVDPDSQNLTAESIARVLTPATRAIMPVHLAGWPCDMPAIMAFAEERGIAVIEDCAQAHGARVAGRPVGSFGDAAAFSFCQDKIMTTGGEGGMLVTRRRDLWERAWSFKDHGKDHATVHRDDHPPGFRWLHEGLGSNYRLTEMQAAIGRVQLGKLDDWVERRRAHAGIYREALAGVDALRTPLPSDTIRHACYKFYTFLRPDALRPDWDRLRILNSLAESGVPSFTGSCPEIYREKALVERRIGPPEPLPVAHALGETSLMFLVHPTLKGEQVAAMARAIASVVSRASH